VNEATRFSDLAKSSPSGIAACAEVVEVGDDERSWQPAGRSRLRGMKADTAYHVPSETR
jgi:class 3 adenylate cyclase